MNYEQTFILLAGGLFAGSFLLSAVFTAAAGKVAAAISFVARPSDDRYHRKVIPLGGGAAIFGTMAVFILASIATVKLLIVPGHLTLPPSAAIHTAGFLKKAESHF